MYHLPKSLQLLQINVEVFIGREEWIETLLLYQMIGQPSEPVTRMRREGDLLLAQVEEDVSGSDAEDDTLDVDHARVAHLDNSKNSFKLTERIFFKQAADVEIYHLRKNLNVDSNIGIRLAEIRLLQSYTVKV